MRNLFYIVACLLVSILVGLLSPLISPELFNIMKSNNKEIEYVEVVEIEPEESIKKLNEPILKNEKVKLTQVKAIAKEKEDDNYIEELPPETMFRINRYGKWEFWNYYRDFSRVKFSKKMRNLYEEIYNIKNKKEPKFKYSIHVFASKKTTLISYLKLKGLYENFDQNENLYRYFYRSFDNYWICRRELREVRSNGFPDAYIVKL